jgi:polysaccharide biosynthesis protein PslH
MRQLVRFEAHALKRYEQRIMRKVDSVIAISSIDATELDALSGIKSIVVPPYLELQAPRETVPAEPMLGYIGHLGWQPNVIGLDWFCNDVWPLVRQQLPDARLTIAGPGLARDEQSGRVIAPVGWRKDGIEVVGFVDDLNDLYNQTAAMVAPVVGGSGVRMKLLETLSAGLPTVTTPDGALGLDVLDGRELLIASDATGFAERVVRVLSDARLQKSLRANGYEFLNKYHSKSVAVNCFKKALQIRSDN